MPSRNRGGNRGQNQKNATQSSKPNPQQINKISTITEIKLDSRHFSKKAYKALTELKQELKVLARQKVERENKNINNDNKLDELINKVAKDYQEKSSGLIQSLSTYISTWGLHRLSGDMKKFLNGTAEDTIYKGKVYHKFLSKLNEDFSAEKFDVDDVGALIDMKLRPYTALNHLAIKLAKEWSFWSSSVLGEPKIKE